MNELTEKIRRRIEASPESAIRFRDYMELCLYDPQYGYYMKEKHKIGREGDYYTGSGIGTVLGDVLALYITRLAADTDGIFTVTEWGAGTGRLATLILDRLLSDSPELYGRLRYRIVEKSGYHRTLQQAQLQAHRSMVSFTEAEDGECGMYPPGLVLSNELLDAFPIHRVRQRPEGLMELCVGWNPQLERFTELELPCSDPDLTGYLEAGGLLLSNGQIADINLEAPRWIKRQSGRLGRGTLLTIDYGDQAKELFATHRMAGTLMCYKAHLAFDNPYLHAGEQDITAHVDFSACIRAGLEAGLTDWRLLTQKQFLLDNGVLELLQEHNGADPFSPAARRNRAIRQLLLSDQMSELFKVLIQRKRPK